mgnify:FL=1
MTNKKLKELIDQFIASKSNMVIDEWYATERDFAIGVMADFLKFLKEIGIRIKEN